MGYSFYILCLLAGSGFALSLELSDYDNVREYYDSAIQSRENGDSEKCLRLLSKIEVNHIESNYIIAEIYLNEIKNPNIALDYYNQVMKKVENSLSEGSELEKNTNLYRKSLFMSSYIYSNYLGMYSTAYKSYESFLEKFPNDELIESVKYEMELLKPLEDSKKQIIRRNDG